MNARTFLFILCALAAPFASFAQDDFPPDEPPMGPPPGGFGGPGGHGGMHGKQKPDSATYILTSGTVTLTGKKLSNSAADNNVVQCTGGTLNLKNCTLAKEAGDASDPDGSSFYGSNSAAYVNGKGAVLNINGGSITSSTVGTNAAFAGNGGTLNISGVKIHNTGNLSRGIHATGGGIINAKNLEAFTEGNNSSVVATDRGGGTVNVKGGTYTATGRDCAILYSTGNISISNASGKSAQGEVGVIEGDNEINIEQCDFTSGSSQRGLMILQSGSGDAQGFNGRISIIGGTVTLTDVNAPLCEIPTNTTGTLTLKDVKLNVPSGTLMSVDYNDRWRTHGGTGNLVLKTAKKWTVEGTVKMDSYAKALNVTVGKGVTWNLTGDAAMSSLTVEKGGKVITNGHSLKAENTVNNGLIE